MIKSILTAATVIALVSPAASAGTHETIEVVISYDTAQVETSVVKQSIKEQAREACTLDTTGSRLNRVDTECVTEIVEKALTKING